MQLPEAVTRRGAGGQLQVWRLMATLLRAPARVGALMRLARRYRAANRSLAAVAASRIARTRRARRRPSGALVRALVTGATGFVGAAVARALLREGWEVRALVRARARIAATSQRIAVEVVEGDLADAASLERALRGCEALFHVAADYRLGAFDPQQLYQTNVEGTRNILNAAREAGVRRIVYTSSVATIGIPAGWLARHRGHAVGARGHDRPLQALQISRGGGGAGCGRAGSAGRHRQPVDADRAGRRQADAYGTDGV